MNKTVATVVQKPVSTIPVKVVSSVGVAVVVTGGTKAVDELDSIVGISLSKSMHMSVLRPPAHTPVASESPLPSL